MIPATWDLPDPGYDDPSAPGRPLPALVSLHFLRSALRRQWVVCALSAVLGLLAAAAFLLAFPAPHEAKAMLVLAHDPQADPERAMSTDVTLLTSRTVAVQTIAGLGLTTTPDDFLASVVAEPVSTDLVSLTLTAPSEHGGSSTPRSTNVNLSRLPCRATFCAVERPRRRNAAAHRGAAGSGRGTHAAY